MNQEIVEVVEIGDGGIWVEGVQRSACGSCSARAGCGQHTLNKLGRPVRLWVETKSVETKSVETKRVEAKNVETTEIETAGSNTYRVGDQVTLALPSGSLAFSALSLYGLPLIGLVLGAILGNLPDNQGASEVQSMLGAVLGLVLGLGAARWFARRNKSDWQPKIVPGCVGNPQPIEIQTLN